MASCLNNIWCAWAGRNRVSMPSVVHRILWNLASALGNLKMAVKMDFKHVSNQADMLSTPQNKTKGSPFSHENFLIHEDPCLQHAISFSFHFEALRQPHYTKVQHVST